jgi:hypothetical protein
MSLRWIEWSLNNSGVPQDAVCAGHDIDRSELYVIRAQHEHDLIPGKYSPHRRSAYIPYGGKEHFKTEFEILIGTSYEWIHKSRGIVPISAFDAGYDSESQTLYVGRVNFLDTVTPGKVHPKYAKMYISYAGMEEEFEHYEVLCEVDCRGWIRSNELLVSNYRAHD